jgi:hypothetical protein
LLRCLDHSWCCWWGHYWPFKKQHVSSVRFPSVEKTVMQKQTAFQNHSCRPLRHSPAFPAIPADPCCIPQPLLLIPTAFSGILSHCLLTPAAFSDIPSQPCWLLLHFPAIPADPCCIQRHSQPFLLSPAAFTCTPSHFCRPLLHSAAFHNTPNHSC